MVQEAYIKIWRYADRYLSTGTSPMTWMITIARNSAIDRLRRQRETEDVGDLTERLSDRGPTPEQSVVAASEAARIVGCLDQLEADKGRAVRGVYLEGQSYADLAAVLDVPLNTMRT